MGAYKNFISDFPSRCNELLNTQILQGKRDVTLMLLLASSGIIIPLERLKASEHISGDRETYNLASQKIDNLANTCFLGSEFWIENPLSWEQGKIVNLTGRINPYELIHIAKPVTKEKKVREVINLLRNSLAHGNILTMGGQISEIIFLKRNSDFKKTSDIEYGFLIVSPNDFREFLINWFEFTKNLNMNDWMPDVA